ncbi:TonB-dependent siderophore receptor [Herbaspirillum rubrisubalbicans]|nr:TonB-dependent siderophore receptor [Herbaspirillum rubrisubalbicans]
MISTHIASFRLTTMQRALLSLGWLLGSAYPLLAQADDSALPPITVTGGSDTKQLAEKVSGGALGERSELDTPFSTRAVTSDEIVGRQASSLAEVLKYDASVTNISPANGTHPATVAVRGLRLDDLNGYKIDGLANINRGTEMPLEMFDQVEVLKGLSGFMYGFGSPGGIVNYVSKRPTDDHFLATDLGYASGGTWKEHVDAGGRFGNDQRFGYRVNLVNENGDIAADHGGINRQAIGASFDARLTKDLTVTLDAIYQRRIASGGTDVIVSGFKVPNALDGASRLYSNGSSTDVDYRLVTLSADYRLSDDWKATFAVRHSESVRVYKKDQYYITSNSGNYRDRVTSEYHGYEFNEAQAMVQGKVRTGWLQHELVFGAMAQNLLSTSSVNTPKPYIGTGNIYAPTIYSVGSINYSGGTYRDEKTTQSAFFASDTMKFDDRWSVLAGVRYTNYGDTAYTTTNATSAKFTANPMSPTAAVMYKPRADTTAYVSYAEALEQSASAPTTTLNANQTFAPIKSKQAEVGVKTEHEGWNGSLALFRIERGSQYINSANIYVADGQSVYRGVELNGSVQMTRDLSLDGSLMVLGSEMTHAAAAVNGKRAVGAADMQAGAQLSYRVPTLPGLSLHAGAQYIGTMALDSANANMLSPYSLFDAGLNYFTYIGGHLTTWSANITNLANRKYWTYYQETYLNVGAPRTLNLNVRAEF